jgi:hypothetical protein
MEDMIKEEIKHKNEFETTKLKEMCQKRSVLWGCGRGEKRLNKLFKDLNQNIRSFNED